MSECRCPEIDSSKYEVGDKHYCGGIISKKPEKPAKKKRRNKE